MVVGTVSGTSAFLYLFEVFLFSSRRRHTSLQGDWSSDVCSSDLVSLVRSLKSFAVASVTPVIIDPETTFIALDTTLDRKSVV